MTDRENLDVGLHPSPSFYQRIMHIAEQSPGVAISSVCALFITIILAIVVPSLLAGNFCKHLTS